MRHRASGFGGQWHIKRRQERGTEIEVRLPLARIMPRGGAAQALPATG
jgi:nitrate/nitrite-specific signal transduction histidine kinase